MTTGLGLSFFTGWMLIQCLRLFKRDASNSSAKNIKSGGSTFSES
jgi:hypothetical protein